MRRHFTGTNTAILLAVVFFGGSAAVRGDSKQAVTMPIRLEGVHVNVDGKLGEKPVQFTIDTGASMVIVNAAATARLGIKGKDTPANVTGVSAMLDTVQLTTVRNLTIGEAVWKETAAAILPMPEIATFDMVLGTPFFRKWAVTIDYARSSMTLCPHNSFKPPAGAEAMSLHFSGDVPYVLATVDGIEGWFMMDTGGDNSITVSSPFVKKHSLRGRHSPAIRMLTGVGIGGFTEGDLVRLTQLTIGSFQIARPTAELSVESEGADADEQSAGSIGGEVWRRFTVTLDYPHSKAYLVPNSDFNLPFAESRSGVGITLQKGVQTVVALAAKGPAEEAGIKVGDIVLSVDDKPAAQIKAFELSAIFRREPGTKIRLRVQTPGQPERTAVITLRDML